MDKPQQSAPESEEDLERIRRTNNERRAIKPESPVSEGDSRAGVLAEKDEPVEERREHKERRG